MAHQRAYDPETRKAASVFRAALVTGYLAASYRIGRPSCFSVQSVREYRLWTDVGAKLESWAIGHTTAPEA
jgi:hypothetical protein